MRRFWDAVIEVDPSKKELDEGRRFPLCRPEPLVQLFDEANLHDVEVRGIPIPTIFSDFDDYWSPFLESQGPAGAYAISLTDEARAQLGERIRANLPIEPDCSIHLIPRLGRARHPLSSYGDREMAAPTMCRQALKLYQKGGVTGQELFIPVRDWHCQMRSSNASSH
jgi:hypothetical protein